MRLIYRTLTFLFLLSMINGLYAQDLEIKILNAAALAEGRVGAGLMLAETGETVWLDPDGHYPMQSVYKLPISMALLAMSDSGIINLNDSALVKKSELIGRHQHSPIRDMHPEGNFYIKVRDLVRYAVSESDGTASDVLMRLCGGPSAVQKYLAGLGLKNMLVLNTEKEIGENDSVQYRNYTTPRDAVRLLFLLNEGKLLKPASQKLLMQFITETRTGMKRLKGRLPDGTSVAHKTGSSGINNGTAAATNDMGIVTLPDGKHMIIAVFVSDSKAPDAVREDVIARIARLGWDYWLKK